MFDFLSVSLFTCLFLLLFLCICSLFFLIIYFPLFVIQLFFPICLLFCYLFLPIWPFVCMFICLLVLFSYFFFLASLFGSKSATFGTLQGQEQTSSNYQWAPQGPQHTKTSLRIILIATKTTVTTIDTT